MTLTCLVSEMRMNILLYRYFPSPRVGDFSNVKSFFAKCIRLEKCESSFW